MPSQIRTKLANAWTWIKRDTTSTEWLIVLLTAVIAGTSYMQWGEIHSGSKDTHDLAVAAQQQAASTHDLAVAAGKQADRTKDLADRMKDQADRTKELARATRRAADAAVQTADSTKTLLEAGERPWVGMQSQLEIIGNVHANASMADLSYELTNVGKSFALGVESVAWIKGGFDDGLKLIDGDRCEQAAEVLRRNIANWRKREQEGVPGPDAGIRDQGAIMFPGESDHVHPSIQGGSPHNPDANIYILVCTIYYDQFRDVHMTQNAYCMTSNHIGFQDVPISCGKGNYAY